VTSVIGPRARVVEVRELSGGTSSAVHAIDVEDAAGPPRQLVLRRYVRPDVLDSEPGAVIREAQVLEALAKSAVPAPRLVASDPDAISCDVPAVLMSRLPGRTRARARDLDAFARALAEPLAAIHEVGLPTPELTEYRRYEVEGGHAPPLWTRHPAAWERAIERHAAAPPPFDPVFIHRDYHPGNLLWSSDRVSGIVDWAWSCAGPSLVDVAHCRRNLVLGIGADAADRFLAAATDPSSYDPAWDLLDAVDALGGLDDAPAALARLDDWVVQAVSAAGLT
jgi:aminoglycoside phosphotransferase (APT) family kinase protein